MPSTPPSLATSSTNPKNRSATSALTSAKHSSRLPSNSASKPRKRLFPPPTHPQTSSPLQNKGPEDHTINTSNGRILLSRRRYHDPDLGSCFPLDVWIDRREDTVSLGLRELACRLNLACRNFDKAAENLGRAAQVYLSGELLRQIVESEGKAIQAAANAGTLPVTWMARDCVAHDQDEQPTQQSRVYLGCDGVMVPLITQTEKDRRRQRLKAKRRRRGKKCRPLPRAKKGADGPFKEFKIVTLYDDASEHRLVSVTRGDCEVAGQIMRRDAARVALDGADDKVAIVDGADWIRKQIEQQSLPLDGVLLDFYHLAENVHKARRVVFGEADPKDEDNAGNQWAAQMLRVAKQGGYEALDEALCIWVKGLRGGKRQAALALVRYVMEREEMVSYPEFAALGRQIGSGPTESMCKATTRRLKGNGKRWDGANAEAIMALEALEQSGAWCRYWQSLVTLAA
jgi:hypothetical protein